MKNCMDEELTPAQQGLADCYDKLLTLVREHAGELAPFEERNAKKALACLWQIMNGLDLDPDQLYDIGV